MKIAFQPLVSTFCLLFLLLSHGAATANNDRFRSDLTAAYATYGDDIEGSGLLFRWQTYEGLTAQGNSDFYMDVGGRFLGLDNVDTSVNDLNFHLGFGTSIADGFALYGAIGMDMRAIDPDCCAGDSEMGLGYRGGMLVKLSSTTQLHAQIRMVDYGEDFGDSYTGIRFGGMFDLGDGWGWTAEIDNEDGNTGYIVGLSLIH